MLNENYLDGYMYHMTHFDNLRSILKSGALLSQLELNVWRELGSPKALPIQQGSKSQERSFKLMIEPQTKIYVGDLGSEASLKAGEIMRTLASQPKGI